MNMAPAPEQLTKAFNEAIKPYLEQIELLRNELEDTTIQVQQLEDERADMHAWIDKRGLRAGKIPTPYTHLITYIQMSLWTPAYIFLLPRRPTSHRFSDEQRPLSGLYSELPH